MLYIGIEDLAIAMIINKIKKVKSSSKVVYVSYDEMAKFGADVKKYMDEQNNEVILIMSRERTKDLIRNYSDLFDEYEGEKGLGIRLREKKSVDELMVKFWTYLSMDVLNAFINVMPNMEEG